MIKQKTLNRLNKLARVEYHRIAAGLHDGCLFSRGKPIEDEVTEYLRQKSRYNREVRNVLKTWSQKVLVVTDISQALRHEFGSDTTEFMTKPVQGELPGFERA